MLGGGRDGFLLCRHGLGNRDGGDPERGAFGIPEPRRDTPVLPPQAFDLAVVPAVAFDRAGFRIGRGGGYYDRYLAQMRGVKIGLCYTQFLLPSLPRELHDERVDLILTEEGECAWV